MRREMAVVAAALSTGLLVAGCSGGPATRTDETGGSASCAAVVQYNGRWYGGIGLPRPGHPHQYGYVPRSHMEVLGAATVPPCDDTPADPNDNIPASTVQIARVKGYDEHALVAEYPSGSLYVRHGRSLPETVRFATWLRWRRP